MKTRKLFAIILALGLILCQVPGIAVAAETTIESSLSEAAPVIQAESISEDLGAEETDSGDDAVESEAEEESTAVSEPAEVDNEDTTGQAEETVESEENATAQTQGAKKAPARAPAATPESINSVTINVATPTAGATNVDGQSILSLPSDAHYSLKAAYWGLSGNSISAEHPGPLEAGTTYYLNVYMETASGYYFNQDSLDVTVNGTNAQNHGTPNITNIYGGSPESSGYFYIAITPVASSAADLTTIDSVTINVTPPAAGTTVVDAQNAVSVPSGEHYSIPPYVFYDFDPYTSDSDVYDEALTFKGTFEAGKTYYISVSLLADEGYMFSQVSPYTTVNVTGATLTGGSYLLVNNVNWNGTFISAGACVVSFTIPAEHTVTFDMDGLYAAAPESQTVADGETASVPTLLTAHADNYEVNGLSFLDWSNKPASAISGYEDFWGSSFDFITPITADTTVYATWRGELTVSAYDVTNSASGQGGTFEYNTYEWPSYNTRGGSFSADVVYNMPVFLRAKPSDGYNFVGWSTSTSKDNVISTDAEYTYTFKQNTTLYGLFEKTHVHDWGEPTYTWAADNTSVTATRVCTDDATHVESETVNTTAEITKPATCVAKGETTYTATFENAAFATQTKNVEDVAIDPNAHDWDNGTVTTAPTCTEKGVKTYTCENDASHTKTEDVDALGHDWGAWTQTKAPTCTEEGTEEKVCNHDASHKETRSVAKIDHTWDAGVITKDATCEEGGVKTYTCTVCGETKTEVISALGHDWDDGVVTTDPTCTEKGVKTFTCKHDASHTKTEDVDALGHTWGAWTVTKEATETEDGEETRTCNVCGETETRAIPHLVVEYRNTEGDGSKWEKGSSETLEFVFKRSINDETSFSHFTGIQVDGNDVDASNYTAVSGSVVVNLKPAYLETLATGEHTITALFDDGNNPTAKFTVTEKKQAASTDNNGNTDEKTPAKANDKVMASTSPATGDNSNIALWGIVMIASLLCLIFALISRRSYYRKR